MALGLSVQADSFHLVAARVKAAPKQAVVFVKGHLAAPLSTAPKRVALVEVLEGTQTTSQWAVVVTLVV
jgi:hypothetical protein